MTQWTENIASDEVTRFDGFAAELRALQTKRTKPGIAAPRALHAKPHIGLVGALEVGTVPEALRVAVFAEPRSWPVYARFSNGSSVRQHDGVPDARGIAVKLVGVPGEKIIKGLEDKRTQDFLFIPSAALPFRTPDEFVAFVREAAKGGAPPLLVVRLLRAFGIGRGITILKKLVGGPKVTSMVKTRFHTGAPIRFGDAAVKLALFPVPGEVPGAAPASASNGKHALREELVHHLQSAALEYSVRAQLFVDEATTPIEDASVVWPESASPFIEIARLKFPKQDVTSAKGTEIEALIETLSFDPWHAVAELRPLGAVNRARGHAYRESVLGRGAAAEPDDVIAL